MIYLVVMYLLSCYVPRSDTCVFSTDEIYMACVQFWRTSVQNEPILVESEC